MDILPEPTHNTKIHPRDLRRKKSKNAISIAKSIGYRVLEHRSDISNWLYEAYSNIGSLINKRIRNCWTQNLNILSIWLGCFGTIIIAKVYTSNHQIQKVHPTLATGRSLFPAQNWRFLTELKWFFRWMLKIEDGRVFWRLTEGSFSKSINVKG